MAGRQRAVSLDLARAQVARTGLELVIPPYADVQPLPDGAFVEVLLWVPKPPDPDTVVGHVVVTSDVVPSDEAQFKDRHGRLVGVITGLTSESEH
jgi:hypothetical protein